MAIVVPGTGFNGTSDAGAASLSLIVNAQAVAGDTLVLLVVTERAVVPSIGLNGNTSAFTMLRADTATNFVMQVGYKVLTSGDLNGTITVTSPNVYRHAMAQLVVRGGKTPTIVNGAFSSASVTAATKSGPVATPTADNALLVGLWALARTTSPYTGYTFTTTWDERVEASATSAALNPTAYISTHLLSTGTSGVAQTAEAITGNTPPYDAMASVLVFTPAATTPPSVVVSQTGSYAIIDARSSISNDASSLTYTIAPTTGVETLVNGRFLVPVPAAGSSPVTYTVTATQANGLSAPNVSTVSPPAAQQSGSITETVILKSGTWT